MGQAAGVDVNHWRKVLEIREILVPPRRTFVDSQVGKGDDGDLHALDIKRHGATTAGDVVHSVDRGHDLDAKWRNAEANDALRIDEQARLDRKGFESECSKRCHNA